MSARFHLRACQVDTSGYYHPRWDQATPIEVVAETQGKAFLKAQQILGPARRGRVWSYKVDRISDCCDHEATP